MASLNVHETITKFLDAVNALIELDRQARVEYNLHHRELVDIQHEIELSEDEYPDEVKLAVFDQLHEIALKRRKAKDTILLLDILKKHLQNGTQLENISSILKDAEEEWGRNYSPRELKELDFSSKENLLSSRLEILTKPNKVN